MPNFQFFSRTRDTIDITTPNKIIDELIKIIEQNSTKNNDHFIQLIRKKRGDFLREIDSKVNSADRNCLIYAYLHFAETLRSCVLDNSHALKYLSHYYLSSDYKLISSEITHQDKDDLSAYNLAAGGATLSLGLLALSGLTFGVGLPILGILGLSIAFTILIPSLFYLAVETLPHQIKAIKEEATLFKAALTIEPPESALIKSKELDSEHTQDTLEMDLASAHYG